MSEFNFRRAHREWAQPQFARLSVQVRLALQMVIAQADKLQQNKSLDIDWPADNPQLKEAFDAIPVDELGKASRVIYYYGHWSSVIAVIVHYPGLPPRRFEVNDWDVTATGEARAWVEALDSYNCLTGERTEDVRYEYVRSGFDNTTTCGAYWKFEKLARQSLRYRGCTKTDKQFEILLGWDSRDFMDHKGGEPYDLEDAYMLFRPFCVGKFRPRRVTSFNHKPHPFVIGPRHVAYASEHGGLLGEEACRQSPCAYGRGPGFDSRRDACTLPYDEHTCEHAVVFQCLPGNGVEQLQEILRNTEVQALLTKYGLSGVAMQPPDDLQPWAVLVRCTAMPVAAQGFDDQRDKPEGTYRFTVQAVDREQAEELALDEFHATVPIANLEDFEVVAEALGLDESTNVETASL